MRPRLTSLILILALVLQGMLPTWAHASVAVEGAVGGMQHHCDDQLNLGSVPAHKCPHCNDAAMALFGCGNSCATGLAMPAPELNFAASAGSETTAQSSKPVLSHSAAPPTPPPIS
jgi:hypothetical protein